jgi:hypothetical protein
VVRRDRSVRSHMAPKTWFHSSAVKAALLAMRERAKSREDANLGGVFMAGFAVTAADPSGLWGLLKETFACQFLRSSMHSLSGNEHQLPGTDLLCNLL